VPALDEPREQHRLLGELGATDEEAFHHGEPVGVQAVPAEEHPGTPDLCPALPRSLGDLEASRVRVQRIQTPLQLRRVDAAIERPDDLTLESPPVPIGARDAVPPLEADGDQVAHDRAERALLVRREGTLLSSGPEKARVDDDYHGPRSGSSP